jgi:MscS family membrane protein
MTMLALLMALGGPLLAGEAPQPPVPDPPGAEESWLGRMMPEVLTKTGFLLQWWQWIVLLLLVGLAVVADFVVAGMIRGAITRMLELDRFKTLEGKVQIPEALWKKAERPFGLMAFGLVVLLLLPLVALADAVQDIFIIAASFVMAAAGVWASYRLMDLVSVYLIYLASKTATKLDDMLIPLLRKIAKVFVLAIGIVFVLQNLSVEVGSLLAGLGIGGLAFALAAKDTVSNIFGSITVLFDQPFQIGDWVVVGDVEGTVERVGFRSTRVRTFYNSMITLPNSKLITSVVDNYGSRRFRRYKASFGLTYDTPPWKIEAFCEGIRELVRIHPYTRKDYFHVYVNDLGASAVDVLIYIFHETPDWGTELRERHRFLMDSLRFAERLGVGFAFPSQTVYLESAQAPPPAPKPKKKAVKKAKGKKAEKVSDMEEALETGRRVAVEVVRENLPENTVPPPVTS